MQSIGVVITCYQYGSFIPEAVDSVLRQTRRPDHVVLVDDASGDGSAEIIAEEAERLRSKGIDATTVELETNRGSAAARNAGIGALETEWVLVLDGDDTLKAEAVEAVERAAYHGRRRIADVVIGHYEAFGTGKNGKRARGLRRYRRHTKTKYPGAHPYVSAFLEGHRIGSANSAFLRSVWEIGPYDETLQNSEDTAFWMRAAQNGARFTVAADPLSNVRFHGSRKSFAKEKWPKAKRIASIRDIIGTPPPVEFVASERHFIDHLAPVWLALPPRYRGRFITHARLEAYARGKGLRVSSYTGSKKAITRMLALGMGPVVTCASGDQKPVSMAGRASIFFEHGAGQTYRGSHSSYAGWNGREGVILFVVPGDRPEEVNRVAYPRTPIIALGCPKLDTYLPPPERSGAEAVPTVAVSFHWDCRVNPETRSALPEFGAALPDLKRLEEEGRIRLLGHGHPRIWKEVKKRYEAIGIEPVKSFEEVMRRADLYVCDNSSTIFEFAALDRPVVLMNPSYYRRKIEHGLRFWKEASIGLNCNDPGDLSAVVLAALEDGPAVKAQRRESISRVYRFLDGRSSYRSALAIMDAAGGAYMNPLHNGHRLRILKRYPSHIQTERGRKMAKVEQPKNVVMIALNEFRNKQHEGHVRAGRAFLTTRSRAKHLLRFNARYPENTPEDNARLSQLEAQTGEAMRNSTATETATATEKTDPKKAPANPKRQKPAGPDVKKPAGPETTKANDRLEAITTAKDPASAEVAAVMQHADTESDEELAARLEGLETNETMEYRGYTIGEATPSGGWREIRDKEGVLVKRLQGPERCTAYIDDLLDSADEEAE